MAEGHQDFGILHRTQSSLVFVSSRYPNDVFVLFQVRSVQGRDILLGPDRMAEMNSRTQTGQVKWTVHDPDVEFDETKHYSGYYKDEWNNAYMFAIWRKVPGGEPLPIQALFYPRRVKAPSLVSEKTNSQYYNDRRKGPHNFGDLMERLQKNYFSK